MIARVERLSIALQPVPEGLLVLLQRSFYLGATEVTQGPWKEVMGSEPWKGESWVEEGTDYPAVYVSLGDASEFCRRLTERERRAGRIEQDQEYRLPSEAEWEWGCRSGSGGRWCLGDAEGGLGRYAWYWANARDVGEHYTHRLGQKRANGWDR